MSESVSTSAGTAYVDAELATAGRIRTHPTHEKSRKQSTKLAHELAGSALEAYWIEEQPQRHVAESVHKARRQAAADQRQAAESFAEQLALAQLEYQDFCELARLLFVTSAERSVLGLNGKMPADARQFVDKARQTYQAALDHCYVDVLAIHGYDRTALRTALRGLDAVLVARESLVMTIAQTSGVARRVRR